jgi:hypothetical protein
MWMAVALEYEAAHLDGVLLWLRASVEFVRLRWDVVEEVEDPKCWRRCLKYCVDRLAAIQTNKNPAKGERKLDYWEEGG